MSEISERNDRGDTAYPMAGEANEARKNSCFLESP